MTRPLPALAMLLAGCLSYKPPAPPSPRDATQVNASMGRTWDAVIDLFAARNIPIRTIERVSGIIVTERLSVGPERPSLADCGRVADDTVHPNWGSYNVLVRGDSSSSSVKVNARWTYTGDKEDYDCSTTHVWEQALESDVKGRAEDPTLAAGHSANTAAERKPATPPARETEPAGSSGSPPAAQGPPARWGTAPPPALQDGGDGRPNNVLLTFEGFRRAIDDMQRRGLLLGYGEATQERLRVELAAPALTEPTLEYHLTRLFLAYGATMNGATQPTLVLQANGQQVGLYTRNGLEWNGNAGGQ
jgi:hypothetical protein